MIYVAGVVLTGIAGVIITSTMTIIDLEVVILVGNWLAKTKSNGRLKN